MLSVITFADNKTDHLQLRCCRNTVKTNYAGNKVYKNGTLSMMHTEEGSVTFSGTTTTYFYYLKDHQGNNRVVMNQNGAVEQANHYYPFSGLFGEGVQTVNQPYKYNGKEMDRFAAHYGWRPCRRAT